MSKGEAWLSFWDWKEKIALDARYDFSKSAWPLRTWDHVRVPFQPKIAIFPESLLS